MTPTVILRVIGAVAALVGGYAHLSLYNDGYKDIPIGNIGEQFLANALGAVAIALGLVVPLFVKQLPDLVWKLAAVGGLAWAVISLVASYFAKRTDDGWFGFVDQPGLKPAPGGGAVADLRNHRPGHDGRPAGARLPSSERRRANRRLNQPGRKLTN